MLEPGRTWITLVPADRYEFDVDVETRGLVLGGDSRRAMPVSPPSKPRPRSTGSPLVKRGLAEMLKGGVIMDVVNPEQAKIAEDAGAVAVMALERVPSDIRKDGGVSRMSDPEMIRGIQDVVRSR